jgi:hypothetical protein
MRKHKFQITKGDIHIMAMKIKYPSKTQRENSDEVLEDILRSFFDVEILSDKEETK